MKLPKSHTRNKCHYSVTDFSANVCMFQCMIRIHTERTLLVVACNVIMSMPYQPSCCHCFCVYCNFLLEETKTTTTTNTKRAICHLAELEQKKRRQKISKLTPISIHTTPDAPIQSKPLYNAMIIISKFYSTSLDFIAIHLIGKLNLFPL